MDSKPKTCSNCLHWFRHGDNSQSGACERVEMTGSKAIVTSQTGDAALFTRPSFSCSQHEEAEV